MVLLLVDRGWRYGLVFGGFRSGLERVLRVLLNECNKALQRAVALVVDPLTGSRRLKLEGREAGDAEGNGRRQIVFWGIHLGTDAKLVPGKQTPRKSVHDKTIVNVGVLLTKAVPCRLQTLAVTTPIIAIRHEKRI